VPCPECRREFQIPKTGVAGLTPRTHDKEHSPSSSSAVDVQECARSIDKHIKRVTSHIERFISGTNQAQAESAKLLGSMQATEREIKNKGEQVKQSFTRLIDRQVSDLLHELQSMKSTAEKEVQLQTDAVQLALTELESFRTSSLELKSKGSPCDITQAASDVRVRANELLQKHVIPGEYHAPSYKFTPVNTDRLLRDDQNFVGHVVELEVAGSGTPNSCYQLVLAQTTSCSYHVNWGQL